MPPSPWQTHLTKFRSSHPKLSMKECMQAASKTYRGSSKPEKTIPRGKNPWVEHVQRYRSANRCTFGEALRGSRATYQASTYRDGKKRVSNTNPKYGKSSIVNFDRKRVTDDGIITSSQSIWNRFKKLLKAKGITGLDNIDPSLNILEENGKYYVTADGINYVMKIEKWFSFEGRTFQEARRLVDDQRP